MTLRTRSRLGFGARLKLRASTVGHLFGLSRATGRWWLIPLIAVLILAAVLLIALQAAEYAAPFVYTLF